MPTNDRVKYAAMLLLIALTATLAVGYQLVDSSPKTSINLVSSLKVGVAVEAPYVWFNKQGQLTGLEVEVVKKVAEQIGFATIEWQQTEFNLLIPEMNAGRFDMIAAGMFITRSRAEQLSFSQPTFHVRQTLLVRRENPRQLHAYEDIVSQPILKVAVLQGSVEHDMLTRLGLPAAQIVLVPDALTGRVAVETGLADCMALSLPSVDAMVKQQTLGLVEVAKPFYQPVLPDSAYQGYGAMAFRKTDTDLLNSWNQGLRTFIGSAEHRALLAEFGFGADDLPGRLTTAEIVAADHR